ncbi:MAG: sigma-54 dependent transcriptional regulator [Planctomycetota bacterium]|jgi:DNA-binding NtrC family response regulator|nr:sigma-54 dependent transcriptional regulator [Planctomycetota bacterium]
MAGIRQEINSQRTTAGVAPSVGGQVSSNSTANASGLPGVIGNAAAMQEVYRITRRVAASNASVLLLGETGAGKEVIANAIHQLSNRNTGPFVKVNCGALSESLLESELFGHVRGAFTGAVGNRAGRFEAAHSGTIFLDEINSTSMHLQVKLLRVLQQKQFERVGDTETVSVDTRVIAASNRDLAEEIKHERFREDLYWRLNVVPIEIPPLRKRREDIPALVGHFLQVYSVLNDRYVVHIDRKAMQCLQDYHWPGNVRELQNYIERSVVMADSDELTCELLPEIVTGKSSSTTATNNEPTPKWDFESLSREVVQEGIRVADSDSSNLHSSIVDRVEKELIAQVLATCNYVQTKAATRLGINRNTLHKKMKDYNLEGLEPSDG